MYSVNLNVPCLSVFIAIIIICIFKKRISNLGVYIKQGERKLQIGTTDIKKKYKLYDQLVVIFLKWDLFEHSSINRCQLLVV